MVRFRLIGWFLARLTRYLNTSCEVPCSEAKGMDPSVGEVTENQRAIASLGGLVGKGQNLELKW